MNPVIELILALKRDTALPQPNPDQSWLELGRQLNDDLFCFGACLAWKVSTSLGTVDQVLRLDPVTTVPFSATPSHPYGFYAVGPTPTNPHGLVQVPTGEVERLTARAYRL